MREVIKLFCKEEEAYDLIYGINPDLPPFAVTADCLDVRVEFPEISESDFLDLVDGLSDCLYCDEDLSPEENFLRFLISNKIVIATAESCTGGMLASSIINVGGASEAFFEGLITYSNASKIDRLGVSSETLAEYGAVSEQTAKEMAVGLIGENVDFAISTTGIAGPSGGSEEKPVGLVYVGVAYKDYPPVAYKFLFDGDRTKIRKSAKNAAIFKAWKYLDNIL